jgi:heptose I phosphotransferase
VNTDSLWHRLVRGTRCLWQRADWPTFAGADWAERIMAATTTDRFHAKQGRTTGRWVLHNDRQTLAVYLKRHYVLPRWQGVLAALWPGRGWSPGVREFHRLEWARTQGLPVPAAVAAGEFIGPWGRLQSFLAVEELAGMLPLHEAIPAARRALAPTEFARWKRGLVGELVRLTQELHRRRWFHKDLYLCHFYVPAEDTARLPDWRGRVHLIDLHRLGHHPLTWRVWQVKDLAQLLFSSEVEGVDARDRLRFWHRYLGGERGPFLRRWIVLKWQRYRRHNRKGVRP